MISVLVPNEVIEGIRAHVLSTFTGREQGGLLLGFRKHGAIEIHSASFPARWDLATSTHFRRSERGHRLKALREWIRSNQTVDWIGEWHTHPGGKSQPSSVDLHNWRKLVRHTGKPMAFLIFNDDTMYAGLQGVAIWRVKHLRTMESNDWGSLFV